MCGDFLSCGYERNVKCGFCEEILLDEKCVERRGIVCGGETVGER